MPRPHVATLWLAAISWVLFAAPALWLAHNNGWSVSLETDSAMRLAQVRDFLHGQNWFDTTQWRMNVPFGLVMHWSRLVDAPIALLVLLTSENFALTVWPILLLFPVLAALARIAERMGGHLAAITALVLGLMAAEINGLFSPGSIDHHNIQLALMLWMLLFLIEQRPRLAAVMMALGLSVGLEILPYAAIAAAVPALWLKNNAKHARDFGLALSASAFVLLLATTAVQFRTSLACDSYSLFYAILLMTGGVGLAGISQLPRHREVAFAVLAIALIGFAASLNRTCLSGPYGAMDIRLQPIFLSRISEARPAWSVATLAPSDFAAAFVYPCFAFAIACFYLPSKRENMLLIGFTAIALAVASFQIRGSSFAIMFALPGLAAALARLSIVPLAVSLIFCSEISFAVAGVLVEGPTQQERRVDVFRRQENCGNEKAMTMLRSLPPGRVAAFVDQGPAILAYSHHSVLAGPYHRDAAGILDTYAIFTQVDSRHILRARGIAYLMTCSASPDWDFYRAKGGLIAKLGAHQVPQWLALAGETGDVAVYRVAKE
jgi:hypothetical protein